MPGVIIILARDPWGPVRIETAADMGELLERALRPAFHADVGDRDLGRVVDAVRNRLPPADGLGLIAAGVDKAAAGVAEAFSAVPATSVPPEPEIAVVDSLCAAARPSDAEFRDQCAPTCDAHGAIVASAEPRPSRPRRAGPEIDVREIRAKLKMTQDAFAQAFGFAVATVRDWEQGRKAPDSAARSLLAVIAFRPNVVKEALGRYGHAVDA